MFSTFPGVFKWKKSGAKSHKNHKKCLKKTIKWCKVEMLRLIVAESASRGGRKGSKELLGSTQKRVIGKYLKEEERAC